MRHAHLMDRLDHPRGTQQRVLAQAHGRRAGVRFLAPHRHLIPAHALNAGDDADHLVLGLEDRPLLDVKLEHRLELDVAGLGLALVADALQFIAELDALAVLARIGIVRW